MKKTKKILSILLSCLMLMSLLSVGVFAAEGTKNNPINANNKWFGYGVDCFLLNTTLEAGDTDGVWYQLTADKAGILQVEHSTEASASVDYQITVNVNGQEYLGYENGMYNMPIATLPVAVGDVISIHVIAQNTSLGGTVYCNAKFITGENDPNQTVKLKGANVKVWVAGGATVYFQDDSLQAEYAAKGLEMAAPAGVTVISGSKSYTDTDEDGKIELKLGGSAGSAGAPAVKPVFAITNDSGADACFVLSVADSAHECVYTDDTDADCNTCGAVREVETPSCQHEYFYPCDATCMICGEFTNPEAAHRMTYVEAVAATCTVSGNIAFYTCDYCGGCWDNEQGLGMPLNRMMIVIPAGHSYDHEFDVDCNTCGETRHVVTALAIMGNSVSQDVNGLAIRVNANVAGMQANGKTAIYDNATVDGYKLIGMGALVSNNGIVPTLEDVDNNRVLNIPAVYLMDLNAETGAASYSIRIVDIPENQKATTITFQTYFLYEDALGQQQIVYGEVLATSYNAASGL